MLENCNNRNGYYRTRMSNSCQGSCQNVPYQDGACQNKTVCVRGSVEGMPLAMSYVPWQHWGNTYETCKALSMGTIFPELNLPFMERSCAR